VKHSAQNALIIFPLAALFNSFSMTALMIALGVAGRHQVAADIALVQGATLALFYAFSANARNLILADASGFMAARLLQTRLFLLLPLAALSYFLSVGVGKASVSLAVVLIARRMSEWIGEIGLAKHESMRQTEFAKHVLVLECVTLMLSLLLVWLGFDLALSTIPWAFSPILAMRRAQLAWRGIEGNINFSMLLPHFGSTAIIGTSIYIFRLSIILITGKTIAGELITAFAIGGLIPTIIGQGFAPTLIHRFGSSSLIRWPLFIAVLMFLIATVFIALAITPPAWLLALGHSPVFWLSVGFSIAGGGLMSVAVVLRARLIQGADGSLVFGPDLLANVLIVASVPFFYQVFGPRSLVGLYCLSACLNLVFLWGVGRTQRLNGLSLMSMLLGIGGLLISPVFFLIDGSLFRDPSFVFDTGGAISRLPVPISVLALFCGIALIGNYEAAKRSVTVVFITVLLFVASLFASAEDSSSYDGAKFILLTQFLLPIFGMILGQMYGAAANGPIFERVALWVLLLVVPAQLAATWLLGYTLMSPMVFVFSIYQHLQYFPMIVVALVTMASLTLWSQGKIARIVLTILMPAAMIQIVGSMSLMAIIGMVFGLAGFVFMQIRKGESRLWAAITLVATLFCGVGYYTITNAPRVHQSLPSPTGQPIADMSWQDKLSPLDTENKVKLPGGVSTRFEYWHYYASEVVESPRAFLFGHKSPPDRNVYPSAHNYWLDVIYNFGTVALLPMIFLLLWTLRTLWRRRAYVLADPMLLGTSMAAVYLLLGENMIKTGMRQPYPGIITFFVWGLLITRLGIVATDKAVADKSVH
jgi:hypothetical protein